MSAFLAIPVAYAKVDMTAFGNIINPVISYAVYPVVALMFAVATVVFVFGVLQLVLHGGDEEARERGKSNILYGVIGMFIMVSAWGIVYVISNTVRGL